MVYFELLIQIIDDEIEKIGYKKTFKKFKISEKSF